MPPGSAPPDSPSEGDPPVDPALEEASRSVSALAGGRFEVFGPLGQDREGQFAFLARDRSADRLVVLKRGTPGGLKVIERLDSSVPPPAGACRVCQTPFAGWDPACPDCGSDIAGSFAARDQGSSREQLLAAVKEAAQGYEVLGDMARASGGASVYFARVPRRGTLVALRLEEGNTPGRRSGLTVAATRMMRPRFLYGTVGGDPREAGGPASGAPPWSPALTPQAAKAGGESAAFPDITAGPGVEKVCPQCGETFGPELRFCPRDGAGLRAKARSEELIGQIIAERYHILAKLGEGGMGRVYLAEHVRMGRRCAVKVMNPMLLFDPDSVSRFNREAANASLINHPNVAAIYDFGETDDVVYLAMELVEGESLAALLGREHGLPESRAIDIAVQVADALNAAHELGIVHRDLKPDNIMITQTRNRADVVKVVDFGIAKATKGGRQTVTRTGFVIGTPAYMSPEQILGDALDGRSDLYSLGCILYEMLTGERAFADASGEVSIGHRLTQPPPRPGRVKRGLSARLDSLVTTAMARAPDQRFQSAALFREALTAAVPETPTAVPWLDWLPWRRSRVTPTTAVPTAPKQLPGTAPLPAGRDDADSASRQGPAGGTTVFRHRSARPAGFRAGWLAAGCIVAAVVGYGGWKLLSPRPGSGEQPLEADSRIVLPKPDPALPPAGPVADTSPAVPKPSVPAPAAAGTLRFADRLPPGASVTVDGVEVRVSTEGSLSLPPGRHLLRVEAPGYRPMTQSANIAQGQTEVVQGRLVRAEPAPAPPERPAQPAPATGTILVMGTLPAGAAISVDGTAVPAGAHEIPVSPGSHWLKVSAIGYRPDSSRIEVRAGSDSRWAAPQLTPLPKMVEVEIATSDTAIALGSSAQLRASVKDETGAPVNRPLVWESSNPEVARVERDGRVTAVGAGRAYIRARSDDRVDSTMVAVLRVAKPPVEAPAETLPPDDAESTAPAIPSAANIQAAVAACAAAFGSQDEQQIVKTYQAKTAQDVSNLRKILELAVKPEAEFEANAVKVGAPSSATPGSVEALLRFTWRNNAGVNKKKDAPFRLELNQASGWQLAACRATEKVSF